MREWLEAAQRSHGTHWMIGVDGVGGMDAVVVYTCRFVATRPLHPLPCKNSLTLRHL